MTNLEWIKTQATTEEIVELFNATVCEKCSYDEACTMASIHYGILDCNTGIIEWLNSERIEK